MIVTQVCYDVVHWFRFNLDYDNVSYFSRVYTHICTSPRREAFDVAVSAWVPLSCIRDQISRITKMLGDEFGTASNIKNRVNRQSVLGAITSAQQRLKLYNKVPPNGLVLYTGTILTDDGKEKKVQVWSN